MGINVPTWLDKISRIAHISILCLFIRLARCVVVPRRVAPRRAKSRCDLWMTESPPVWMQRLRRSAEIASKKFNCSAVRALRFQPSAPENYCRPQSDSTKGIWIMRRGFAIRSAQFRAHYVVSTHVNTSRSISHSRQINRWSTDCLDR